MPTTNGNMKSLKVTDKAGNVYVLAPVDTEARQAIDEAKNLQFDDDFFTSEVSHDQTTVSVGLNGVPIGIDTDSPLKFVQDNEQGIVFGSDAPFSTALAPEYDSSATYTVDDHCMHLGKYYRCNTAISTAEAWTPAHWTETDIESGVADAIAEAEQDSLPIIGSKGVSVSELTSSGSTNVVVALDSELATFVDTLNEPTVQGRWVLERSPDPNDNTKSIVKWVQIGTQNV